MRLIKLALALVITMFLAGSAFGAVTVLNQPDCRDLIAGQSIDSGDVCLEVVGDNLVVTYTTQDGWELVETHLWVGNDLADMPQTKKGNPKIGNFPYNSGDITGQTSYSVSIPLVDLGGTNYATDLCDAVFLAAAHAAVRKSDGNGGYQTETGWGSGNPIVPRGSWAMYYSFQFTCDSTPEPPTAGDCETAFALGSTKLWDILDVATGDPITNRWGWQVTVPVGSSFTTPIYAGAGQNDITKGTHVADLTIVYDGSLLTATYTMISPYYLEETHLYVDSVNIQTGAPGLFGHLHENLAGATSDTYSIAITGDPVYVVAHAVSCEPAE